MIGAARCSVIGSGGLDPDAARYLYAVESEDGQALESGVRAAVNAFVKGCKREAIWGSMKAACILSGARTLSGALKPLVGPIPTSTGFASGDYHRETGLVGNSSSKYIDTGASTLLAPRNNAHLALYLTSLGTASDTLAGVLSSSSPLVTSQIGKISNQTAVACFSQGATGSAALAVTAPTLAGISRSSSSSFVARVSGNNTTVTSTSSAEADRPYYIFCRNSAGTANSFASPRIAFYSVGEAIDLEKLDTLLTELMTSLGNAI